MEDISLNIIANGLFTSLERLMNVIYGIDLANLIWIRLTTRVPFGIRGNLYVAVIVPELTFVVCGTV